MKAILKLLLVSAAVCLLFGHKTVEADDAPLRLMSGSACPVLPVPHLSIRMDAEEVTIRLGKGSYTVDAVFHFFNTGETDRVSVGFPRRGLGYLGSFRGAEGFIQFETWVDNKKVEAVEEAESSSIRGDGLNLEELIDAVRKNRTGSLFAKDARWMVKEVTFPGHAKTTTRVRYEAPYSDSDGGSLAYYIYGTGSRWKDNIGKATFTIDGTNVDHILDVTFSDSQKPAIQESKISEKVRRYEIKDLKPGVDAELLVVVTIPPPDQAPQTEEPEMTYPNSKTVTGDVVVSAPKTLLIRPTSGMPKGSSEEIDVWVDVGVRVYYSPPRRPALGEKVEVQYHDEDGRNVAHKIRVISR